MIVGSVLPHMSLILLIALKVITAVVGVVIGSMAPVKMVTGVPITTISFNGRSGGMTRGLWLSIRKDTKVLSIIPTNTTMA